MKNNSSIPVTIKTKESRSDTYIAYKVSVVSIVINVVLSLFKFLAGIIASSGAMVSDAIHSASDVFSTFIVIIGVKISGRESDDSHRYGHERMECVASVVLAAILMVTSLGIGYSGFMQILNSRETEIKIPGVLALVAAIVSIAVKEWMYHYTMHSAKKINSGALKADAWHHRSDALSSIGSLIGILGARLGFPAADPIMSIVICVIILKAAFDILKDAIDKMVDKSCDEKTIEEMKDRVLTVNGVMHIDDIKTRLFGNKVYVDIEISADGNMTLFEAHDIAEDVHDLMEKDFPDVKHCMVHVNPH